MKIAPETIREELRALESLEIRYAELIEEQAGELTEATALVERWIATTTDDNVEALCWYLREAEGVVQACKDEQARLGAVKQRAADQVEWSKDRLREIMRRRDTKRIDVGTFRVSIRKGSQSAIPTEDVVPALLPEKYQRHKPVEVNKAAIAKDLKAEIPVEGWRLQRGPDSVSVK